MGTFYVRYVSKGTVMRTTPNPAADQLARGLWRENPVFVIHIALCPTLAITNTVMNSLAMGLATLVVLLLSSISIALLRKVIPQPLRITASVLIIGAWVSVADGAMQAFIPQVHQALGIFVQLIVVNCIVLMRDNIFARERHPDFSVLNGLGAGLGFAAAMFGVGAVREVLGYGSFLGTDLFGPNFQPWAIMTIPAGGFFVLGSWLLLFAWIKDRPARRGNAKEASHVG